MQLMHPNHASQLGSCNYLYNVHVQQHAYTYMYMYVQMHMCMYVYTCTWLGELCLGLGVVLVVTCPPLPCRAGSPTATS